MKRFTKKTKTYDEYELDCDLKDLVFFVGRLEDIMERNNIKDLKDIDDLVNYKKTLYWLFDEDAITYDAKHDVVIEGWGNFPHQVEEYNSAVSNCCLNCLEHYESTKLKQFKTNLYDKWNKVDNILNNQKLSSDEKVKFIYETLSKLTRVGDYLTDDDYWEDEDY